jgi:(2R)-3-sulfolactate dehydrogenase (NADP+)
LGYFTGQIAAAGMIGLGMTNAAPTVAPPGGRTRVIGTNPIAFSVPDGQGGVAMQFDQSTTTVARGRITMASAAGEAIPQGWAVDSEGHPTTDPDAGLAGSMTSMGGYKGWGFGLMAELLAAGMTGSVLSRDVSALKSPDGPPHDLGQFYMLIDPGAASGFGDALAGLAEQVAKDEGARMPGQGKVLVDPVEVPDDLWALVCAFG